MLLEPDSSLRHKIDLRLRHTYEPRNLLVTVSKLSKPQTPGGQAAVGITAPAVRSLVVFSSRP